MKQTKVKKENGYAILELLFYISFFAVLSLVVISAMVTMTNAFRETTIQAELLQSGSIMEKMSREIRQASDITSIAATELELSMTNSGGGNKTVEFLLSGNDIQFWDGGSNVGNLNSSNIVVTALSFTQITTANGKAVKIGLTVRSTHDKLNRTVDFYDTVVLRGSY